MTEYYHSSAPSEQVLIPLLNHSSPPPLQTHRHHNFDLQVCRRTTPDFRLLTHYLHFLVCVTYIHVWWGCLSYDTLHVPVNVEVPV